jgi:hypothetical protein
MKQFILLVIVITSIACSPPKDSADTSVKTSEESRVVENQLTDVQRSDGWVTLFDGKSLEGWRFFKNQENNSWEVADGTLHCKPFLDNAENKRSDLITVEKYDNFELSFDWKISPQGNSGVMFHVSENHDQPYATGPEYQIIDNEGYPGDLEDTQLTGANYGMHTASVKELNKVGDWNNSKIIVNKNKVEHWLNGSQVLTYEIGTPEWDSLKKTSKWKDFPAYGTTSTGHIDLQDHGNEVWFKNIFLKKL